VGKETVVLAVQLKVSPEPSQLSALSSLVENYMNAVREVVQFCISTGITSLKQVYHALYRHLRERYQLKARFAIDAIRHGISVAKSWLRNPRKGRLPILKSKVVWLTPNKSYKVDLKQMKVRITDVGELKIIGWHRRLFEYLSRGFEIKEARLKLTNKGVFLYVSLKGTVQIPDKTAKAIAVDMNMREVVAGDGQKEIRLKTRIDDTERIHKQIQRTQKKYGEGKAWLRREGILNRIKSWFERIRNITDDQAKKIAYQIVQFAKERGADTIVLEDLNGMLQNVIKKLPKKIRRKLYHSGIRKVQYWIEVEAKKEGLRVEYVNPKYSSTTCPKCGTRLKREKGRTMVCPNCGFKADRDTVAVLNLLNRLDVGGSLRLLNAPGMTNETRATGGTSPI